MEEVEIEHLGKAVLFDKPWLDVIIKEELGKWYKFLSQELVREVHSCTDYTSAMGTNWVCHMLYIDCIDVLSVGCTW